MFSNTVAIASYTFEEVIYGVKFAPMYTRIDNAYFVFGQVEFIYGCPMYNLNLI
jgi:hypothetical protein